MFIINEFINKHATKNVWNVSDKLIEMAAELVQVQEKSAIQIISEEVGMPESI